MIEKGGNLKKRILFLVGAIALVLLFVLMSGFALTEQGKIDTHDAYANPNENYSQVLVTGDNYYLDEVQEEALHDNTFNHEEKEEVIFPENEESIIKPEEQTDIETPPEEEEIEEEKPTEEPSQIDSISETENPEVDDNAVSNSEQGNAETETSTNTTPVIDNENDNTTVETTKEPLLETTLKNNQVIEGDSIVFKVRGTDYHNRIIDPFYYQVRLNGNLIYSTGVDSDGFVTYRNPEPLTEGGNEVSIYIEDEEGNSTSSNYIFDCTFVEETLTNEYVSLTVDGRILGLGILLSTTEQIYADESASNFVDRILNEYGFNPTGSNNIYGYYLARLNKPGIVGSQENIIVPDSLKELIGDLDYESMDPDSLGERDFNGYSGWVYLYNYSYMGVGLSTITLSDGDEIVICYTLANGAEYDGTWFYYGDW